jgi:hypothetical protein
MSDLLGRPDGMTGPRWVSPDRRSVEHQRMARERLWS